jgi:hypothetical protein
MKNAILAALLGLFAQMFSATYTVSGYAFLEGESDHSGIKVFFQRVAPDTNYSYTANTSSTGYYSQVVENGWYDISFSKSGFDSTDTTDVAIYSNKTLAERTLLKTGLSGYISGVLTIGEYNITDTLKVAEEDSLILEPGVVLNFNTGAEFIVNGYLKAEGTKENNIYINATMSGIVINNIDCNLSYVNINGEYEFQKFGVEIVGSPSVLLNNCKITSFSCGIGGWENCGSLTIDNTIINCSTAIINTSIMNIYNSAFATTDFQGINNLGSMNIYNSIIYGTYAPSCEEGIYNLGSINIYNTNVFGYDSNFCSCGPYIGVIVTTNANGDPCDTYSNISMDPRFVNAPSGDYNLQSDSPCIDAGINTITGYTFPATDLLGNYRIWDGDGNNSELVDMGAYEYNAPQVMLAPQNITGNMSGTDFVLSWNVVSGASSYSVYSSSDPYAAFPSGWTLAGSGIAELSWTDMNAPAVKKFYVVVAVNAKSIRNK